jgi:hypothetical protein
MKSLIITIIIAILAMFITGCTFVKEYHRGYARHEVIVTSPRHLPIGPGRPPRPSAHHRIERRDNHRFRPIYR